MTQKTDICIIGAGHAGCEAALAAARLGFRATLFCISMDSIAMMPCNPNIGGTSKGHLVREIDALGGEMAKIIDQSFIQSRMLNLSKGPAVHSLRAQADKAAYGRVMRARLMACENLRVVEGEVVDILVADGAVTSVQTADGGFYECRAVILCAGTYLNARCLRGEQIDYTGPGGLASATRLTAALAALGIRFRRFKTGTPARLAKGSLDFSRMVMQPGDEQIVPFSFTTDPAAIQREQMPCYLTYTNEKTHAIIRENLHRSPIYAGIVEGAPTRYCPSIEDKVVKFADRDAHQVFIEPEGADTDEMYVAGMSTSLPEDIQMAMYRSVAGLENCEIVRYGYAIEYDCLDAAQLLPTLAFREIKGLYSAGQLNGSSGYEEAAAQGLIAGINAALYVQGKEEMVLDRSEAYIGVLIDDLVTKENAEPYRMMTSRAEYRLLLRQDNADLRLLERGYQVGLRTEADLLRLNDKRRAIEGEIRRLKNTHVGAAPDVQAALAAAGSSPLKSSASLAELLSRPEMDYVQLAALDGGRPPLAEDVIRQVEIEIKYEGYLSRQRRQVEQFKKMENKLIPPGFDYDEIKNLRLEAREKLGIHRPLSLGQAARISGVSPADVAVLMVAITARTRPEL